MLFVYLNDEEEMTNDREIIKKINAGDTTAFELIIENYKRLVYNIVFRMVQNTRDVEDLCQDVFVKVYRNLTSFQFQSKLSTWIAKIAHNQCINFLRKQKLNLLDDMSNPNEHGDIQFSESLHTESTVPDTESEKNDRANILRKEVEENHNLDKLMKEIVGLYKND